MSRKRYTRIVRKRQQSRFLNQEKELLALSRKLMRSCDEQLVVPTVNEAKARRSARIEQNWRHKISREDIDAADQT